MGEVARCVNEASSQELSSHWPVFPEPISEGELQARTDVNSKHMDQCEATESLIKSLDISISLNDARINDNIRLVGRTWTDRS